MSLQLYSLFHSAVFSGLELENEKKKPNPKPKPKSEIVSLKHISV